MVEMDTIAGAVQELQRRLTGHADAKTKQWWERYLRQAVPFRGVKMAHIRAVLYDWLAAEMPTNALLPETGTTLALTLLRQSYCEDKLAGILLLQEILIPAGDVDWRADLPRFAALQVIRFVEAEILSFSTEGLNYAVANLPVEERTRLKRLHKERCRTVPVETDA